ncbi:hypothetical protein EI94DRAFT_1706830 [Lactarius quietus]|nr:hypothetical protein EI94DRAFT_1706830 [Lactarius quietus]
MSCMIQNRSQIESSGTKELGLGHQNPPLPWSNDQLSKLGPRHLSPDPLDPEHNTPVPKDLEMNTHLGDGEADCDTSNNDGNNVNDTVGNDNNVGNEDTQADPLADTDLDIGSDNVLRIVPNLQATQKFTDALRDAVLENLGMELEDLDHLQSLEMVMCLAQLEPGDAMAKLLKKAAEMKLPNLTCQVFGQLPM